MCCQLQSLLRLLVLATCRHLALFPQCVIGLLTGDIEPEFSKQARRRATCRHLTLFPQCVIGLLTRDIEPEFSKQARRRHFCMLFIVVCTVMERAIEY